MNRCRAPNEYEQNPNVILNIQDNDEKTEELNRIADELSFEHNLNKSAKKLPANLSAR